MNNRHIDYLEALGIELWVPQGHVSGSSAVVVKFAVCLVAENEWQNQHQALFKKIMSALHWPEDIEVVFDTKALERFSASRMIAFGDDTCSDFEHPSLIKVESLQSMLTDPQAKKKTWLQLKPYALTPN